MRITEVILVETNELQANIVQHLEKNSIWGAWYANDVLHIPDVYTSKQQEIDIILNHSGYRIDKYVFADENAAMTETDNETSYGRKEDGFVLSPVDPNRIRPVRKRAKWKDEEAKKLRANNAALKAQGNSGGREQGFALSPAKAKN
jgi:hypothetical protein